jgi:acetyl-CoA carboxylase biotin carboxyl carrier protein
MSDIVERIVDLVAGSAVRAVTVSAPGLRVTVRKRAWTGAELAEAYGHAPADTTSRRAGAPSMTGDSDHARDAWTIRAQRVGVFRHADPRIVPGTMVRVGQSVGVIVSMNLPSDVRAHRDGVVGAAMVDDGAPVEFDQPLFVIAEAVSLPDEEGA